MLKQSSNRESSDGEIITKRKSPVEGVSRQNSQEKVRQLFQLSVDLMLKLSKTPSRRTLFWLYPSNCWWFYRKGCARQNVPVIRKSFSNIPPLTLYVAAPPEEERLSVFLPLLLPAELCHGSAEGAQGERHLGAGELGVRGAGAGPGEQGSLQEARGRGQEAHWHQEAKGAPGHSEQLGTGTCVNVSL